MEKEKFEVEETVAETTAPSKKKNLKWLWITLALIVVAGIAAWCAISSAWGKEIFDKYGDRIIEFLKSYLNTKK